MYVCIDGEEKKGDEKVRRVYPRDVYVYYITYLLIVARATRRACSYLLHHPLLFR